MLDRLDHNFKMHKNWCRAFLCSVGVLLLPVSGQASTVDIDQIGNRRGKGGATNFMAVNQVQQSFVPHLAYLDGVEVVIQPGNPGLPLAVRLEILDGENTILSKAMTVEPNFSGVLSFDLSAKPLEVRPGSTYWLRLQEDSVVFFWTYDAHNPYPDGEAYANGKPMSDGQQDFRFRTLGH